MPLPTENTMRAIGVEAYGPITNLQPTTIPKPGPPTHRSLLVATKAVSVNPIDIKVRAGTYDDAPDYYTRVAAASLTPHVMGYDGAGVVLATGPDVRHAFQPGDEIFFLASPTAQGTYAEQVVVDERHAAHKPRSLDWAQAAAMPLTYGTAYEALVERLQIAARGEKAGLLVVNGAGGVGSIAIQIARKVLGLPVVVATASRPETEAFARRMGATHVVNHREDVAAQIKKLGLLDGDVPLKYALVSSRTEQYVEALGKVLVPFGRVCSIVQAKFDMYGSEFMSKSLGYVWCWVCSGAYHGYVNDDEEKHHRWFEELATLLDNGTLECHLTKRKKLTLQGIQEAHQEIEAGKTIGKIALAVDEDGDGECFC